MRGLEAGFAAVAVIAMCGAAQAADWSLAQGAGRGFAHGEAFALAAGDVPPETIVQAKTPLRLARGGDALNLGPDAEIKLEGENLVRVFKGALGATFAHPETVMTTYAEIVAETATFGVVVEPYGASIAVRSGHVEVIGLTTRGARTVNAGEIFRVEAGRTGSPEPAAGDEAAMAAADGAPGDAEAAPEKPAKPVSTRIEVLDLVSTGAIGPVERASAAVPRSGVHAAAAAAAVPPAPRLDLDEAEIKLAPWDPRFQWTEIEDGDVRLKPLWRVIAGMDRPQAATFWLAALLITLISGAFAAEVGEGRETGLIGNSALSALAFAATVLIRDAFCRDLIALEPYLTLGLAVIALLLALYAGSLSLPDVATPRRGYSGGSASGTGPAFAYPASVAPEEASRVETAFRTLSARIRAALAAVRARLASKPEP